MTTNRPKEPATGAEARRPDLGLVNEQLRDMIASLRTSRARFVGGHSAAPATGPAPEALPARVEDVPQAERRQAGAGAATPARLAEQAARESDRLERRLEEVEADYRRTRDELADALEGANELAHRYVALEVLHAARTTDDGLRAIREIVINFIGSEELAVYLVHGQTARRADAVGKVPAEPAVPLGQGTIGRVAAGGPRWVVGHDELSEDPDLTACIPLRGLAGPVGVVAIWRLLGQKAGLGRLDAAVFELLERHGGQALSARSGDATCMS